MSVCARHGRGGQRFHSCFAAAVTAGSPLDGARSGTERHARDACDRIGKLAGFLHAPALRSRSDSRPPTPLRCPLRRSAGVRRSARSTATPPVSRSRRRAVYASRDFPCRNDLDSTRSLSLRSCFNGAMEERSPAPTAFLSWTETESAARPGAALASCIRPAIRQCRGR